MPRLHPHRLLVEGDEDKRVIPQLMEYFISWGNSPDTRPVHIESFNGLEEMLKPGVLEAELKISGLKALGVILDANSDAEARWGRIRERVIPMAPILPEQLPTEGVVFDIADGPRFGAWLMPDNRSRGMLETFLAFFVPTDDAPLWHLVEEHCAAAKARCAAPYKEAHLDKVQIHAWLALQDPPGQQLHLAILTKTLKPTSPHADPFVAWFRRLYSL